MPKQITVKDFHEFDEDLYHKSFKYNVTANTTNEYSESFSSDVYIYGGMYEVIGDVNDGDYVEFSVTDEDNVLGYGAGFVVSKFLETEYVNPDRKYREVVSEDGALVPSSLYLNLTYHSAGNNAPKVLVRYLLRK